MAALRGDLVENFVNLPDNGPRIVVIGETGCGKSSLLNKLAGARYVQLELESGEVQVECTASSKNRELFVSARGRDSVTQRTTIQRAQFSLDPNITLYLIDTPGTNDGSSDAISHNHSTDAQLKLQRLQFIHLLLICVPGLSPSGRIKHSTRDFLRGVACMFEDKRKGPGPHQCFWNHVVLAYTQCDEWNKAWRQDLSVKKTELREYLANELGARRSDGEELPVLTLSSVQSTDDNQQRWSQSTEFLTLGRIAVQKFESGHRLQTSEVLQFSSEVAVIKEKLVTKQQELVSEQYAKDQLQLSLEAKVAEIHEIKANAPEAVPQAMRVLSFGFACIGAPRFAMLLMLMSFFKERVYFLLKLLLNSTMFRKMIRE